MLNWFIKKVLIDRIVGALFVAGVALAAVMVLVLAVPTALIKGVTWTKSK